MLAVHSCASAPPDKVHPITEVRHRHPFCTGTRAASPQQPLFLPQRLRVLPPAHRALGFRCPTGGFSPDTFYPYTRALSSRAATTTHTKYRGCIGQGIGLFGFACNFRNPDSTGKGAGFSFAAGNRLPSTPLLQRPRVLPPAHRALGFSAPT